MNGNAICLPLTLNKKILPGLERIEKWLSLSGRRAQRRGQYTCGRTGTG